MGYIGLFIGKHIEGDNERLTGVKSVVFVYREKGI